MNGTSHLLFPFEFLLLLPQPPLFLIHLLSVEIVVVLQRDILTMLLMLYASLNTLLRRRVKLLPKTIGDDSLRHVGHNIELCAVGVLSILAHLDQIRKLVLVLVLTINFDFFWLVEDIDFVLV